MKRILLWDMPDAIMLIVEHASGVVYQNQVGGNVCWQAELEGVLAPLDLPEEAVRRIQEVPYASGRQGISAEIADTLDEILAADPHARSLRVDRARLGESWEAWVYVTIDAPESATVTVPGGDYFGPVYGFGRTAGVLTWPNSD